MGVKTSCISPQETVGYCGEVITATAAGVSFRKVWRKTPVILDDCGFLTDEQRHVPECHTVEQPAVRDAQGGDDREGEEREVHEGI